jgi:hypothetical protein
MPLKGALKSASADKKRNRPVRLMISSALIVNKISKIASDYPVLPVSDFPFGVDEGIKLIPQ